MALSIGPIVTNGNSSAQVNLSLPNTTAGNLIVVGVQAGVLDPGAPTCPGYVFTAVSPIGTGVTFTSSRFFTTISNGGTLGIQAGVNSNSELFAFEVFGKAKVVAAGSVSGQTSGNVRVALDVPDNAAIFVLGAISGVTYSAAYTSDWLFQYVNGFSMYNGNALGYCLNAGSAGTKLAGFLHAPCTFCGLTAVALVEDITVPSSTDIILRAPDANPNNIQIFTPHALAAPVYTDPVEPFIGVESGYRPEIPRQSLTLGVFGGVGAPSYTQIGYLLKGTTAGSTIVVGRESVSGAGNVVPTCAGMTFVAAGPASSLSGNGELLISYGTSPGGDLWIISNLNAGGGFWAVEVLGGAVLDSYTAAAIETTAKTSCSVALNVSDDAFILAHGWTASGGIGTVLDSSASVLSVPWGSGYNGGLASLVQNAGDAGTKLCGFTLTPGAGWFNLQVVAFKKARTIPTSNTIRLRAPSGNPNIIELRSPERPDPVPVTKIALRAPSGDSNVIQLFSPNAQLSGDVTLTLTGVAGSADIGVLGVDSGVTTIALTGQAATGSVTSFTLSETLALTGQAGTTGYGTLTPSVGYTAALTGQAGTGALGVFTLSETLALTGQAGTGALGVFTLSDSLALTGQAGTAGYGTLTPSLGVTLALTGQAATGSVTTFTISETLALTGQAGTAGYGTLTPNAGNTVALTGQAATGSLGVFTLSETLALTGQAATASVGTLTPSTGVVLALTGQAGTGAVGLLSTTLSFALAGQTGTAAKGNLGIGLQLASAAATASKGNVGVGIQPTSAAATGSTGVLSGSVSVTLALAGQAAAATVGTLTPGTATNVALTGVSATGSVRAPASAVALTLVGNTGSALTGNLSVVTAGSLQIVGVSATAGAGALLVVLFDPLNRSGESFVFTYDTPVTILVASEDVAVFVDDEPICVFVPTGDITELLTEHDIRITRSIFSKAA